MLKFFTKNLLLVVLSFVAIDMMGQINTLKITAPVGIAGDYKLTRFNWGPIKSTALVADAAYGVDATAPVNDGCSDLTNDLTGKIGFIDRGTCGLPDKAQRLEKAGAIAAIICNTATGTDATAVGGGAIGNTIKVSSYMLSAADCQKIKASVLAGTVKAELVNVPVACNVTYDADVFWGNVKGQGDFANGLQGWTVENADPALNTRTTWFYSENGFPRSARGFTDNNIKSNSQCNGAACMDLETLQFEDNPNPAQPYNRYTSDLISPPINCTGKNSVILEFRMFHNRLNGNAQISFFDGSTWSDPEVIATNNSVKVSAVGETVRYPLPQFANKEGCRVKFTVSGDFYTFVLDDVLLFNRSTVDVRVNSGWVATAPTYKTPKTQLAPMPFLADIENVGNTAAPGTKLKLEIKNASGAIIQTLEKEYGNVDGSTTVENGPFDDTYTPPAIPGRYTGTYTISSPSESPNSADNNTFEFEFWVTEKTFGNLLSEEEKNEVYLEDIRDSWNVTDMSVYHSAGNIYHVPSGKDHVVSEVRFGLNNPSEDIHETGFVYVDLFELTSLAGISNPAERVLVGTATVTIDSTIHPDLRNIKTDLFLPDADGFPDVDKPTKVALKDNTNYFITLNTAPLDPDVDRYELLCYSPRSTTIYDRSVYPAPTNLAFDTLGIDRACGSYWKRDGLDETYADSRSRSYARTGNEGFQSWAMVYLEMDVENKSSTYEIATSGTVNVFPNPASRELFLDITLDNVSDVRVDLVSIEGKTVSSESFKGVQDSRLKLDLGNLISGTYTAMIHTNNGVITKKVIVQK